jgi:hypothetical protein
MRKKKDTTWLFVGIGLMLLLFVGRTVTTSSKGFEVVHYQATQIDGYEAKPESVKITAGPALKKKQLSPAADILGWIFWVLVLGACWYVRNDMHQRNVRSNDAGGRGFLQGKGIAIILAPVLFCAVFWFAKVGSKLDHDSWQGSFTEFVDKFQISEEIQAEVREKGSSGNHYIKDENGLLTEYFKGK